MPTHDIFLSYSSKDRERIIPLVERLEKEGWKVWWDTRILHGQTFDRVIEKNLDASKCVVVCWSKYSIESDWVRNEAGEGAAKDALIPAMIDQVKIPLAFRRMQTANLIDINYGQRHQELEKFIDSIHNVLGTEPRKSKIETKRAASKNLSPAPKEKTFTELAKKRTKQIVEGPRKKEIDKLQNTTTPEKAYSIGDEAFGGIVFEVDKTGQHGKVCSKEDLGKFTWIRANKESKAYKGGGYTDWYLPSKDELDQMYINLHKNALGDFAFNDGYWSSTEVSNSNAWLQAFFYGNQNSTNKGYSAHIRAVRSFHLTSTKAKTKRPVKEIDEPRLQKTTPIKVSIGDKALGGIVFKVDKAGQHGKVCSKEDLGRFKWQDAIDKCKAYNGGGFTDWYLPSKEELNQMYTNLHRNRLGGFDNFYYWSSTETNFDYAWYQDFYSGYQSKYYKVSSFNSIVRAVRAF